MHYFVYMVRCSDGSYYVGITNNVDRRVAEHNLGIDEGCYTNARRPVEVVFVESFREILDAIFVEKKLKGWGRAKKEALIAGDWSQVHLLAKRRGGRTLRPFEARASRSHLRVTQSAPQGDTA
ncbi:MAG: GIY-YIG nuclease family protein [Candidatus Eremiobacteraeota bacterium]|nr:GIY-YIG nuclease family protein [Candidatus Eremiobacteraeota bacterium]